MQYLIGWGLIGLKAGRVHLTGPNPEARNFLITSKITSTHPLKPVLYWFFDHFGNANSMKYDIGAGLYPFFPVPWLVCPLVVILILVYITASTLTIFRAVKDGGGVWYQALFNYLIFSAASFIFITATLDAGILAPYIPVGIALLTLYLLTRYVREKQEKKWLLGLILLPMLVYVSAGSLIYSLYPSPYLPSYSTHLILSVLSLVGGGLYEFRQTNSNLLILAPIVIILAFNFATFTPLSSSQQSKGGDEAKITLNVNQSVSEGEVLREVAGVASLSNPKVSIRGGKMIIIKADAMKAGLDSQDLYKRLTGVRVAPHQSIARVRFYNPSSYPLSFYIPLKREEISTPLLDDRSLRIKSITEVSKNLTKVNLNCDYPGFLSCTVPFLLALDKQGKRPSYALNIEKHELRRRPFLRALIPVAIPNK